MFNIGDYVICKRDLCKIKDIQDNYIMGKKYYILSPIDDDALIINIPCKWFGITIYSSISKYGKWPASHCH